MSLNQKYTWAKFLREHPELKAKQIKRTSKEGKKAFEEAFQAKAKAHVKELAGALERQAKRAAVRRDTLIASLKSAKGTVRAKALQAAVGRRDRAIATIQRQIERAKTTQKSF